MSKRMVDLKVEDGKIASIDGHEVGGGTAVEANPQEEATQQLEKIKIDNIAYNIAGGGTGGIAILNCEQKTAGGNNTIKWYDSEDFVPLKANTAYEVGNTVALRVYSTATTENFNNNQFMAPLDISISVNRARSTIKYGDVVLALTEIVIDPTYKYEGSRYSIKAVFKMIYTVVKAGTTGADVTPLTPAPSTSFTYLKYTLGTTQA